jgi:hypothetical protein
MRSHLTGRRVRLSAPSAMAAVPFLVASVGGRGSGCRASRTEIRLAAKDSAAVTGMMLFLRVYLDQFDVSGDECQHMPAVLSLKPLVLRQ